MKKSSKGLILLGTAAIAISMGGTSQLTTQINRNTQKERIQAYNHNPANILDNTFMDGNTKILPFIFDNISQTVTPDKIREEFKQANLTVKSISTGNTIGTGTTITVEENSDVYTVLIYGDVNGDGKVDLADIQRVILQHLNGNMLNDLTLTAGNVSNTNTVIDITDIQRLIIFYIGGNLNGSLVVNEPVSIKEAPVITIQGNNPQVVKYGATSYSDAGATAVDKDGKTLTVQTTGTINTNKVGEQYITYTATDAAGNTTTQKRTVIVKDYASKVEITKQPKTSYNVGESLDLSNGEITITYASNNTTKVIPMSECTASGYTSTAGSKTITLSYTDTALFEPVTTTFTVTVTGSVTPPTPVTTTGIRLDTSGVITNYAEGDTISASGLKVYAKKSNNTETEISLDDVDITYSDTVASANKNVTITITYATNDGTFTESFDIEITVLKPVSEIIPSSIAISGAKHKNIEITLSSGDGEADLVAESLSCTVTKDDSPVGNDAVTVQFTQNGSKVTMTFKATELGEYVITPSLGNIHGTAVTINVTKDNLEVTDIEFNIPETTKFIAGKEEPVIIPITFIHKYAGTTDEDELELEAKEVYSKIAKTTGLEVELWKSIANGTGKSKIENPETSTDIVSYIGIRSDKIGEYNLSITMGSANISETIKVEEAKLEMSVNRNELPVYIELPEDDTDTTLDWTDVVTLLEFNLTEGGEPITIDRTKVHIFLTDEDGTNEVDLKNNFDYFGFNFYTQNKIEASHDADIKYIGITAYGDADLMEVNGKKIKITYDGIEEAITLTIKTIIPEKTVKTILPSEISKTGAKHENIEITLSSGDGEADLVAESLSCTVTKDDSPVGNDAVTVQFTQNASKVTMTFKATELGTYVITPSLGNINGTAVTINVTKENLEVTDIEFNIPETTKFIAGKEDSVIIPIAFIHKYAGTTDEDELEVKAKEVYSKIAWTTGLEVELWKSIANGTGMSKIENPETSTDIVSYIAIRSDKIGEYNLSITMGSANISETIKVEEAKLEMSVNRNELPVYIELPEDDTDTTLDWTDVVTLLEFNLTEGGEPITIDRTKVHIFLTDEDGTNEVDLKNNFDYFGFNFYAQDKTEASNDADIKYIGITAYSDAELMEVNGKKIKITYDGIEEAITLTIQVKM